MEKIPSINYIISQDIRPQKKKERPEVKEDTRYILPIKESEKGKYIDLKL